MITGPRALVRVFRFLSLFLILPSLLNWIASGAWALSAGAQDTGGQSSGVQGSSAQGSGATGSGAQSAASAKDTQGSGGETLSSAEVSSLPLNTRDFSKLLLLAAGTMTDSNGAANFTQQFAVNGQRGTATVFAMDKADTTDPELGGATFSNFNVDAIQEVQSISGVLPADIGHGAAGFTNVIT
jgi:hypothetical protein